MIIQNAAAKISAARLFLLDEQRYLNMLVNSPETILTELDALGAFLAERTTDPSTNWRIGQSVATSMFRIELDHPFSMSSIVVEGSGTTQTTVPFQVWNLRAQPLTLNVANANVGVYWINPLCGIVKCVAFRLLATSVATIEMTSRQRVEYNSNLINLAASEDSLRNVVPFLWRLPEEYIGVGAGSLFVRRSVNVPVDGRTFSVVTVDSLPSYITSAGLDYCITRTQQDVKAVYPTANISAISSYIEAQGAAAWFDTSFDWLQISNVASFIRTLSSHVVSFIEQDYDRYAFVIGEFAEWMNGNIAYDASTLAATFDSLAVILNKLSHNTLAIVPSLQHRSLLSLVTEQFPSLSRDEMLATCAAVDMLRSRLTLDYDVSFEYTNAEATELSILSTLVRVAYLDWPVEYSARLTVDAQNRLVYALGGNVARSVVLLYQGHSEYTAWAKDVFSLPAAQQAARTLWASLLTMFEICVTMLASEEVTYITTNGVRTAIIKAQYSKLYGRMMYYMCSPMDTVIVPVRSFA